MTFLPIVGRELRVAARSPATYRNRVLTVGAVTAVAFLMLFFASLSGTPSLMGETTFRTLSYLAAGFCLLEGLRKTADCLSGEKREGTLGLLFLTDLRGYDVVLGKLAATSLNSVYGLVAILPILTLPLLLGGVTEGEYWRVVLSLLDMVFFSLCAGMCVSAFCRQEESATAATAGVISVLTAGPFLTFIGPLYALSPLYAFYCAFDAHHLAHVHAYWKSLGFGLFWSWLLLVVASFASVRFWQEKNAAAKRKVWLRRTRPADEAAIRRARAATLELNPVLWLAEHNRGQNSALYVLVGVTACGTAVFVIARSHEYLPVFLVCAWALNFILKTRVAAQACHCMAAARRNNTLELLLATPLTVRQIIEGQTLALRRIFVVPAVLILCLELAGLVMGMIRSAPGAGAGFSVDPGMALFISLGYLPVFGLDMMALTYAGMWFGLTSKKESQAAVKTIFYVLLAPYGVILVLSSVFSCLSFLAFPVISMLWMSWAQSRLYDKLRELAGERYGLIPLIRREDSLARVEWQPRTLPPRLGESQVDRSPSAVPPRIRPPVINP